MTEISGGGDRTVHISPFIIEEELKTGVDQTENTPDTKVRALLEIMDMFFVDIHGPF